MPVHDWTRVDAGLFHDFHQGWTIALRNALNAGLLPPGYVALAEQRVTGPEPDVVALEFRRAGNGPPAGAAVATPPTARFVTRSPTEAELYAARANRIAVRHRLGRVVAVLEVVSPGNKSARHTLQAFVAKAVEFLRQGVHLLVIDLFPPGPRDPNGIHKAIWDEFQDEPFELPADKPLTLASYECGPDERTARVEPVGVGDVLPDMPLFLQPGLHVPVPLEATYATTWAVCPEPVRELLVGGAPGG